MVLEENENQKVEEHSLFHQNNNSNLVTVYLENMYIYIIMN